MSLPGNNSLTCPEVSTRITQCTSLLPRPWLRSCQKSLWNSLRPSVEVWHQPLTSLMLLAKSVGMMKQHKSPKCSKNHQNDIEFFCCQLRKLITTCWKNWLLLLAQWIFLCYDYEVCYNWNTLVTWWTVFFPLDPSVDICPI